MSSTPLAARVATIGARITLIALALVAIGTSFAVDALLAWKTDRFLNSVNVRVSAYLDSAPAEKLDWKWVTAEVDEVRPHDVRVEVRSPSGTLQLENGSGPVLVGTGPGCKTDGTFRVCVQPSRELLVLSAVDRSDDLAARDRLLLAIALVSAIAGATVVAANRRAMMRAVQPLSELARRVRSLEPGAGERLRMLTDIAEVDLLSQRFDDLVERFEQALTREKRFAAEASHELRTPLTVARAEIEALPRSEGTARALQSLHRLTALVDALLWFARAQARLDRDQLDVVNLADLVREQVEETTRNGHTDSFSLQLPDEALARGDEHLLRRSLANLLDNAVKYGENSQIHVELQRIEGDIVLSVRNGGPGIPDQLREQIFEPFFRVSGQASSTAGFGLGLPFARAVARAHGGDVLLSNTPEGVTELLLRLPLAGWNELAAE